MPKVTEAKPGDLAEAYRVEETFPVWCLHVG